MAAILEEDVVANPDAEWGEDHFNELRGVLFPQ